MLTNMEWTVHSKATRSNGTLGPSSRLCHYVGESQSYLKVFSTLKWDDEREKKPTSKILYYHFFCAKFGNPVGFFF